MFTKSTEVFLKKIFDEHPPSKNDSFMLSTSIGNTENIIQLINEYRGNKFVSAQLFPESTMSSASVNINRLFGLQGGNMSINPNSALNDAILLALLDATHHSRTTHLLYGDVNKFTSHLNIPNYLIYIRLVSSDAGSWVDLRGCNQAADIEYTDLSIYLNSIMSPSLYQFITAINLRGDISNVYFKR